MIPLKPSTWLYKNDERYTIVHAIPTYLKEQARTWNLKLPDCAILHNTLWILLIIKNSTFENKRKIIKLLLIKLTYN